MIRGHSVSQIRSDRRHTALYSRLKSNHRCGGMIPFFFFNYNGQSLGIMGCPLMVIHIISLHDRNAYFYGSHCISFIERMSGIFTCLTSSSSLSFVKGVIKEYEIEIQQIDACPDILCLLCYRHCMRGSKTCF